MQSKGQEHSTIHLPWLQTGNLLRLYGKTFSQLTSNEMPLSFTQLNKPNLSLCEDFYHLHYAFNNICVHVHIHML